MRPIVQPYGPVELGHIVSTVAELALKSLLGEALRHLLNESGSVTGHSSRPMEGHGILLGEASRTRVDLRRSLGNTRGRRAPIVLRVRRDARVPIADSGQVLEFSHAALRRFSRYRQRRWRSQRAVT